MERTIISNEIESLESLNIQLERIEGALKLYAVAFEDSGMFSKVSTNEVSTALHGVYEQVKALNDDLNRIIERVITNTPKKGEQE